MNTNIRDKIEKWARRIILTTAGILVAIAFIKDFIL